MFATPMAYQIDESGMIAAEVAVGAEPIRAVAAKLIATDLTPEPAKAST